MNYLGFGKDPSYIYSFRGDRPQEGIGLMMKDERIKPLRESLAYKQAGAEGKQRMERVVSMGLPVNTDINKIQRVGYDPEMQRPIYRAPRPQPWGTWGSFKKGEKEEPVPTGISQPESLTKATQIQKTELGESGGPLAFTGFGQMARNQKADQYQTPIGSGLSNLARIQTEKFGETSLTFPFAGVESAFERGVRTTTAGLNVKPPTAAIGDMPMFPSSRFSGPQPAERIGPIETQPRRSWMY